ncbi:hypothetical protein [Pelagibius sp. Alg239-R121]|uniref:hypothetical protein n=1 Tax=Pelagibius sp. Alg239-R121 TaxID=2993448 RepID=UPI0024A6F576|nr:hypothetical protein [Pelagibius sp. Alg239-R121]
MAFKPAFMSQLEDYYAEAESLVSQDDWMAFDKKWFDRAGWPQRQYAGATRVPHRQAIKGRRWMPTFCSYDLSAEARYHYFAVLLTFGTPLRFPGLRYSVNRTDEHWTQHCPHCEISTHDLGDERCPLCARVLLYEYIED